MSKMTGVSDVKGMHPVIGEEVTLLFKGDFPVKDPETNIFATDPEGRILFGNSALQPYVAIDNTGKVIDRFDVVKSGRARARFDNLNDFGQEVLDTRPMAAAVMFSDHIPPEVKIRQMMQDANFRAQVRAYLAEEQGVDTFDEFDYADDMLFPDKEPISAHEVVHDNVVNRNIPRFLQGRFKAVSKAVQAGTGPLAGTPANSNAPAAGASKAAEGEGAGEA